MSPSNHTQHAICFSITTRLVVLHMAVLAVPREATHLSVSSLPVALEQFTLAVRHCPDREDQALLMKVGYQLNSYFLKAS